jgi:RNA polymerase sigma-70 factor (ECF subfamily)
MATEDSFAQMMARLRAGDPTAEAELFERFRQRLIGLARAKLDARLRAKVDPEDVVQSVYHTFFRRHAEGRFELGGWQDLWSLLTVLTVRKCGRWREHFYTDTRNVQREVPADEAEGSAALPAEWVARDPDPVEAIVLIELVEALLRGQDEADQAVVSLRLQGHQPGEISARLGRPLRSVHRVLERVKRRLERLIGPAAEER